MTTINVNLANYKEVVNQYYDKLISERITDRLWKKDYKIWRDDPDEISNRLNWLDCDNTTAAKLDEITAFVDDVKEAGFKKVLLLGMGGSSLAPEVISKMFGSAEGHPELSVLDSTHPDAVKEMDEKHNPEETLFIVSTKSGGTVETISFMKYFYNKTLDALGKGKAGTHFAAITDPGSGLEAIARELNFRKIFLNDPNIGGRFSALSFFGMVPAALIGVDVAKFLTRAAEAAVLSKRAESSNPGAVLGLTMGALATQNRDKLTLLTSDEFAPLGAWLEQLIAESVGKEGKGILPIDLEHVNDPDAYNDDRVFVFIRMDKDKAYDEHEKMLADMNHPIIDITVEDVYDLGGQFMLWEIATAIAGWVMDIQPFDQPNVESAKVRAKEMMKAYKEEGELPKLDPVFEDGNIRVYGDDKGESLKEILRAFLSNLKKSNDNGSRGYVAIQAFINPSKDNESYLQRLRGKIQRKYKCAATIGFGPRFLHSTGQLHKGDAGNGLFIQITDKARTDLDIPDEPGVQESEITFGVLKEAQSLGDRQALLDNGRKLLRVDLNTAVAEGIESLSQSV